MATFGEKLRQARKSREVQLDEVAKETRIAARYLEALEKGELAELPGSTFAKGYLRTYAHYLGLDPEPLVEIYLEEEAEQTREGQIAPGPDVLEGLRKSVDRGGADRGESLGKILRVGLPAILVLGLVAVLIFVVVPWLRSPEKEAPVTIAAGPETDGPPAGVTRAARPEPSPAPPAVTPEATKERAAGPSRPVPETQPATPTPRPTAIAPPEPAGSTVARTEAATTATMSEMADARPEGAGRLSVSEAGVGTAVVNRSLQGESDRFAEGTRIVFWNRVLGGGAGDEIRHVWIREGVQVGSVSLSIGASHWRTHSRRTLGEGAAGRWAVEARDAEGRVLARREFRCEAGEGG